MIKALIFDFDGVILESVDVKGWAFQKIFENHPAHSDKILAYHYENGGVPRVQKIKYILKEFLKLPYDDATVETYCRCFEELVFKRVIDSPFVPGAQAALAVLSKGYLCFIVSGTPHEEMNRIIDTKGLRPYFKCVYGSPVTKDEWTRLILSDHHFSASEVLWIGDAASDWRAAKKYGICFLLRSWPGNMNVFSKIDVDFKINDLTGLPELVEQLNRKEKQ